VIPGADDRARTRPVDEVGHCASLAHPTTKN
jgi:hypothetical protein